MTGIYARINAAVKAGTMKKFFIVSANHGTMGIFTECDTLKDAKREADYFRAQGYSKITIDVTADYI